MTDWAIPQQAKLKYTQLFNLHDRNRTGFLSGLQCRDILLQSGLPRNILAEIWNLSDIDGDGQLTREEFILAMHLTNHVRSGQTLPTELPGDLVPPSYRRARSISATSVHSNNSATSSTSGGGGGTNDDLASQKSSDAGAPSTFSGSILSSNSFEDKRRENFEKGRAELERRRLKMIEQQISILNEQLITSKKQVAEAKSKIDAMRSDRDTKAGLITSLEAQLKAVLDRKAFLQHEEQSLIAIAKDLNLVNSTKASELDEEATLAKQASINKMKESLAELEKEKEEKETSLNEAIARVEESKKQLKTVTEEVNKSYENYKEKLAKAKVLRAQFIDENKSKTVDLDSVWDSTPSSFVTANDRLDAKVESSTSFGSEDPWATTKSSNENFSFTNNNFEPARDYSGISSVSPKLNESGGEAGVAVAPASISEPVAAENNNFDEKISEPMQTKKRYRALYAFEARNPDELTINPGDTIIGSEEVCEPGWLSGESNGRCGLFPEAYVELLPDNSFDELTNNNTNNTTIDGPATSNSSETAQILAKSIGISTGSSSSIKYKVVYAFDARNPDELTINPGDIITGLEGTYEPGWLMGELNGQKGLFPEAYVERMAEVVQAEQTTEQTGKSRSQKKAEVATVIANYRALGQEQLNLEKGQLVLIRRKNDSGWWEGELQIKELDYLISELIESEWDFVNDLSLCQSAYIVPLASSFNVGQIFINWDRLIQKHQLALEKVSNLISAINSKNSKNSTADYRPVFEIFQNLLDSLANVYIEFCSKQNESTRQLEAKLASNIRFRQLVDESQRKLKRLTEQQVSMGQCDNSQSRERALRNANLPLSSFLLKPVQRITKYTLLFERMLNVLDDGDRQNNLLDLCPSQQQLRGQVEMLKMSAQALCNRVNEACRHKEDDQDNWRKLRWCQSHIKQQTTTSFDSSDTNRHSISLASVDFASIHSPNYHQSLPVVANEWINFDSNTNCLGPRKFIAASSFIKYKSGRELVLFLFNDLLLLTQIKGGVSLRIEDVFQSERAQQAYYKPYKSIVLLEDLIVQTSDNTTNPPLASSAEGPNAEMMLQTIDFVDTFSGNSYSLIPMNNKKPIDWCKELTQRAHQAREARAIYNSRRVILGPVRKLSVGECFGRLFVTALELNRTELLTPTCATSPQLSDMNCSWEQRARMSLVGVADPIHRVCLQIQLRKYKRTPSVDSGDTTANMTKKEVLPLSEIFRTTTVILDDSMGSQRSFTGDPEATNRSLESKDNIIKFNNDSTQFLIANMPNYSQDEHDYLDIELIEDSRFKEAGLIAKRRISLDHLIGRTAQNLDDQLQQQSPRHSIRSVKQLQPNRPMEFVFRLKPEISDQKRPIVRNSYRRSSSSSIVEDQMHGRISVKLRLHLQVFSDESLI